MSDDSILRDILDALNRVADGVEELKTLREQQREVDGNIRYAPCCKRCAKYSQVAVEWCTYFDTNMPGNMLCDRFEEKKRDDEDE